MKRIISILLREDVAAVYQWFVLGTGVNKIVVSKYARTCCTAVAWSLALCLGKTVH